MRTTILESKTGKMNMGGYFKEKTAQLYFYTFENVETTYFRVGYKFDQCDECFETLEEAQKRFAEISKYIK